MYTNFLEETILTGYINDNYLLDMPNNMLILQNNDYILSILSESFIGKIYVKNPAYFFIPLNNNSNNLIIDWGDGHYTLTFSLNYKLSNKQKSVESFIKGDCFYNASDKTYSIFDGNELLICNDNQIDPDQLCKIDSYQLLINSYLKKIKNFKIINLKFLKIRHMYSVCDCDYYFKIKGNLTGFDNSIFNSFYSEDIYLKLILSWGNNTSWNTMKNAFNNAIKLESIPSAQLPNINDAISAFYKCSSLILPQIKNLLPNALISSTSMFENCSKIQDISFLEMPPYNTVIDRMFANTNIALSAIPSNFNSKKYYSGNDPEDDSSLTGSYCFSGNDW